MTNQERIAWLETFPKVQWRFEGEIYKGHVTNVEISMYKIPEIGSITTLNYPKQLMEGVSKVIVMTKLKEQYRYTYRHFVGDACEMLEPLE